MTFEEATEKSKAYCARKREIVKLMPIVREIIQKFDGKVYNKRLRTALQKAAEEKHERELYFSFSESMNGKRIFVYGHQRMQYNTSILLCAIELADDKRISAQQALASCRDQYAEIMRECANIEQILPDMPQIIRQLSELAKLRKQIEKSIPLRAQEYWMTSKVSEYGAGYVYQDEPEL